MAASLTIRTNGQTLITALYKQDGSTAVTVYSNQNLTSSTTVGVITADTTYWVAADDHYVLSVKQVDGSEIANSNSATAKLYLAAGSPVEVSPMPTREQTAADLERRPGGLGTTTQWWWMPGSTATNATTVTPANQSFIAYPVVLGKSATIDAWNLGVTSAGDAASTIRAGIYLDNGSGVPGALLADMGTTAGDAIAETVISGISVTIPAGLVWLGAAVQGAAGTAPTVRAGFIYASPVPLSLLTASTFAGQTLQGYTMTGVSGALPSTFTVSAARTAAVPRIGLRKA